MTGDSLEERKRALEEAELRQRERQLELSKATFGMKTGCLMILAPFIFIALGIIGVLVVTLLWSILTSH